MFLNRRGHTMFLKEEKIFAFLKRRQVLGRICVKIYRTGTPDTIQVQCGEHELIHGS